MKKMFIILAVCCLYTAISFPACATKKQKASKFNRESLIKLHDAIRTNDINKVQLLLNPQSSWCLGSKSVADVNARYNGLTALMLAAYMGRSKIVQMLLDADARVNEKTKDGWTALKFAIDNVYQEIVQILINASADLDDHFLIEAISKNNKEIAQMLIAAGINIAHNELGSNALEKAAWSRNAEMIKMLLSAGATPTDYFWVVVEDSPNIMKIIEEYNQEVEKEEKTIAQTTEETLPEAGWQDISKIIGGYAARPVVHEQIEIKKNSEANVQ